MYTNKGRRCRGFAIYESIIVMKTKYYNYNTYIYIFILIYEPKGGFCTVHGKNRPDAPGRYGFQARYLAGSYLNENGAKSASRL